VGDHTVFSLTEFTGALELRTGFSGWNETHLQRRTDIYGAIIAPQHQETEAGSHFLKFRPAFAGKDNLRLAVEWSEVIKN
jgi:hypothetical protein